MCTAWIKIVRMRQFLKATRLYDHFLSHFKRHQEKKKEIEPLPNLNRDDTLISQFPSIFLQLSLSLSLSSTLFVPLPLSFFSIQMFLRLSIYICLSSCFYPSVSFQLFLSSCFYLAVSIQLFLSSCFYLTFSIQLFLSIYFCLSLTLTI